MTIFRQKYLPTLKGRIVLPERSSDWHNCLRPLPNNITVLVKTGNEHAYTTLRILFSQ